MRGWDQKRDDIIRKMWSEACTAEEIAQRIGDGKTRSAVLGRMHRLKLTRSLSTIKPKLPPKEKKQEVKKERLTNTTKNNVNCNAIGKFGARVGEAAQPYVPIAGAFQQSNGISLMAAGVKACRWPIEGRAADGNPKCCGRDRSPDNDVYCADHARLAYVPIVRRRKAFT